MNDQIEEYSLKQIFSLLAKTTAIVAATIVLSMSCANRGAGPQGGPADSIPPRLTKAEPYDGQLNYTKNTMNLDFDEIVLVEGAYEKVIVSPPQKTPVVVKALGKRVLVEFADSMVPNTSYTVDFTDAIVDNNEKNPLRNFSMSFTTGSHIDSLQMAGTLLDASNLNPLSGVVVGIHSNLDDTAFTKIPFRRVTKTDVNGNFKIKNIAPGSYHIFALGDLGSNYFYDMPNEQIAFLDSVFSPTMSSRIRMDTLLNDSVISLLADSIAVDSLPKSALPPEAIDTIINRTVYSYAPRGIILQAFTEPKGRQYLVKNDRPERFKFNLYFARPLDSLPQIHGLNFPADSALILQANKTQDTLTYWLPDTVYASIDTLSMTVLHRNTDTLGVLGWTTDTLNIAYRPIRQKENRSSSRKKRDDKPAVPHISLKSNVSGTFDVYKDVELTFDVPTRPVDSIRCVIEQQIDSLWKVVADSLYPLDSIGLRYRFDFKVSPATSYRIVADSAKFVNMRGECNDSTGISFKTRSLEEYGKLIISLSKCDSNEIVQLLNEKDTPLREMKAEGDKLVFEYLNPGTYYLRLYNDWNGDSTWTPGSYEEKRQAETVYYFPYSINIRALWDVEEQWDYKEFPLLEQKPLELIIDNRKDNKK